jgi:hypothetical protein
MDTDMTYAKLRHYFVIAAFLFSTMMLMAQEAKVKVQANPQDASIFVDGQPYQPQGGMLELTPGQHTIGIYDYGFAPQMQKVTLNAGANPELAVKLEPLSGEVEGPWGNLQIKGINSRYMVFLNGRSPDYFVGRVDQMKGDKVVLPPGLQHVIIVDPNGNREVYSGYVKIVANQRATLHVDKSDTYYEKWADGAQFHALPRASSTTMAVAPVSGKVTAYPSQANCGQPVRLVWTSNGYNTLLKLNGVAVGKGGASGEQVVDPKQTTTYLLETFGPGGVTTTPVTVHVNNSIKTSLSATPSIVRYHKIGDNVVDPGIATLNWSAANAQSVILEPIGPVTGSSGQQEVKFAPGKSDFGPVEETRAYKLTATNTCGGSDSTTALVQVAGSIDPEIPTEQLPPELPHTASPLPLIALLGFGSLTSSVVLRMLRRR